MGMPPDPTTRVFQNPLVQRIYERYETRVCPTGTQNIDDFVRANPDQVVADIFALLGVIAAR